MCVCVCVNEYKIMCKFSYHVDPLWFSTDDTSALGTSTFTWLAFCRIKQREVVIVAEFLKRSDISQWKQGHSR